MKNQHTRKIALQRADNVTESKQSSRSPEYTQSNAHMADPQNIEKPTNSRSRPEPAGSSELDIVLERFQRCLLGRIEKGDSEILDMSLRHIFENADILYSVLLPEMTQCTLHIIASNTPTAAAYDAAPRYWIKSVLQDIEASLERLEALSQLLITTTLSSLEALDRSCSVYGTARIKKRLLREGEDEECTEIFAAIEVAHIPDSTYYQWMQALRLLTARLNNWQEQHQTYPVFTTLLNTQNGIHPALEHIDTTMNQARKSITTLFGTILPEFHTVARGDDETVAALLLNVMQYTDLLLSYIDTLLEAVRVLIQQDNRDRPLQ
jgi:hypothetical protein